MKVLLEERGEGRVRETDKMERREMRPRLFFSIVSLSKLFDFLNMYFDYLDFFLRKNLMKFRIFN